MHIAQREIGEVEITTEQLNAVSGGRLSFEMVAAFRNGMIMGFVEAGGTVSCPPSGGTDFSAGGHTINL